MAKKLDSVEGWYTMHDALILDGWKRNEKNWNSKKRRKKQQLRKYKYKLHYKGVTNLAVLVHHVRKKKLKSLEFQWKLL